MINDIISINGYCLPTLVAVTKNEQQRGLMWKEWPPPIMTFPYKKATYNKYWMNNTPSALDIVFCKDNNIIGIYKGNPLSTELIGPNEPSDLVVELPYGTVSKLGIKVGDYIGFSPSIETISKIICTNS
jgi:uncharacterized membrane protein (UPF0127 family)